MCACKLLYCSVIQNTKEDTCAIRLLKKSIKNHLKMETRRLYRGVQHKPSVTNIWELKFKIDTTTNTATISKLDDINLNFRQKL